MQQRGHWVLLTSGTYWPSPGRLCWLAWSSWAFLFGSFRVAFRSEHILQAHLDLFGKNARHLTPGQLVLFCPLQQKTG
jgi:hypothetical protein